MRSRKSITHVQGPGPYGTVTGALGSWALPGSVGLQDLTRILTMSGGRGLKPCEFHSSDFHKLGVCAQTPRRARLSGGARTWKEKPSCSLPPTTFTSRDVASQSGHQPPANARQSELARRASCSRVPNRPGAPPCPSRLFRNQTWTDEVGVGEGREEDGGVTPDQGRPCAHGQSKAWRRDAQIQPRTGILDQKK